MATPPPPPEKDETPKRRRRGLHKVRGGKKHRQPKKSGEFARRPTLHLFANVYNLDFVEQRDLAQWMASLVREGRSLVSTHLYSRVGSDKEALLGAFPSERKCGSYYTKEEDAVHSMAADVESYVQRCNFPERTVVILVSSSRIASATIDCVLERGIRVEIHVSSNLACMGGLLTCDQIPAFPDHYFPTPPPLPEPAPWPNDTSLIRDAITPPPGFEYPLSDRRSSPLAQVC